MDILRFLILLSIKALSRLFYRFDLKWVGASSRDRQWSEVNLALILNHTSLLEPIFAGVLPVAFLWRIASQGIFPVANITLERPVVGRIMRLLAPQVISLSRKRDSTWKGFLEKLDPKSVLVFMPEGRMKRPNGLDKHGKPMTVRGGVVDVLEMLGKGHMMLAYSGGLHQLTAGTGFFPKLFLNLQIRLEIIDIEDYLAGFRQDSQIDTAAILKDLEARRDLHCQPADAKVPV